MLFPFFALWMSMNMKTPMPMDFIKNKEYPVCSQCKHFLSTEGTWKVSPYSKCGLFGEMDVVTGAIEHKFASTCRSFDTLCGLDGKHFVNKEKPTTTLN